jgi:HEAT repeat protein
MKRLLLLWINLILGTTVFLPAAEVSPDKSRPSTASASSQRVKSSAIETLANETRSTNESVVANAIAALGQMGSPAAFRILDQLRPGIAAHLRPQLTDALLACADRLEQQSDPRTAERIYESLYLPTEKQAVRTAALRGLVQVQGDKSLPHLLTILASETDPLRAVAADLLCRLPSLEVTRKIAEALPRLPTTSQVLVLSALANRRDKTALPTVLSLVQSRDESVTAAALEALGPLGDGANVPLLVEYVGHVKPSLRTVARSSLVQLRGPTVEARILECLKTAPSGLRAELIGCLGARANPTVLPDLLRWAGETDPEVQSAAIRALAHWPDATPLNDLWKIAQDAPRVSDSILALQGYVRMLGLPHQRLPADNLKKYRDAFDLAQRVEEKKMVLGSLAGMNSAEALEWISSLLADRDLNAEAALAIVKTAEAASGQNHDAFRTALQKVMETSQTEDIRKQAMIILKRLEQAP